METKTANYIVCITLYICNNIFKKLIHCAIVKTNHSESFSLLNVTKNILEYAVKFCVHTDKFGCLNILHVFCLFVLNIFTGL